ncbi:hypothetical protein A4D02_34800 [Niastella koreensis]|uniref:DUF4254 domain-containing protein n=2 Tax=Niastella koreensis TaxID=354356 RepID=G8TKJ0_NIAKG|nr:DUF4254 domain-containing protein [Niastella koreensis]AEV98664.1 hypothetical protein Niako_2320 [Niastella koreensis GR20-10]OQP44396.1 hypothetical protein A4D02_34800 [Niastella koreensis]
MSTLFNNFSVFSDNVQAIYGRAIEDYHVADSIETAVENPFPVGELEHLLYLKCWIDNVQWHVEDAIRDPHIDATDALKLKRRIDQLNQERTNTVEYIDDYFLHYYTGVPVMPYARVNTESPAWALDRLSILCLKIYHMNAEVQRTEASPDHIHRCRNKLATLRLQQIDLSVSINELLLDISKGNKQMKVYRQMKMYNDENLNPVLYNTSKF